MVKNIHIFKFDVYILFDDMFNFRDYFFTIFNIIHFICDLHTTTMSPLSWKEARIRLRHSLENYLQTDINKVHSSQTSIESTTPIFVSFCIKWNFDFIFGAVGTSVALLVIAIYFYIRNNEDGQQQHRNPHSSSQVVGAAIIFFTSLFSIWLVVRYRYSLSHGTDNLKRRMINKFVKELQEQEERCRTTDVKNNNT
ncbi:MAG: hypothetical protein ACI8RD_011861, partial [Bacillariaceae sp.]